MPRYLVTWEIDYEGEGDPEAAARWAWDVLRKPHSTASVFTMVDEAGNETKIDLAEIDEAAEDDGCPKGDPECLGNNGDCHDACEAPAHLDASKHQGATNG